MFGRKKRDETPTRKEKRDAKREAKQESQQIKWGKWTIVSENDLWQDESSDNDDDDK